MRFPRWINAYDLILKWVHQWKYFVSSAVIFHMNKCKTSQDTTAGTMKVHQVSTSYHTVTLAVPVLIICLVSVVAVAQNSLWSSQPPSQLLTTLPLLLIPGSILPGETDILQAVRNMLSAEILKHPFFTTAFHASSVKRTKHVEYKLDTMTSFELLV